MERGAAEALGRDVQEVELATTEGRQDLRMSALAPRLVGVETAHARLRKKACERLLEALCAVPDFVNLARAVRRAGLRNRLSVVAIVTPEATLGLVIGQADRAVRAWDTFTTGTAKKRRGEASPVEQQQGGLSGELCFGSGANESDIDSVHHDNRKQQGKNLVEEFVIDTQRHSRHPAYISTGNDTELSSEIVSLGM